MKMFRMVPSNSGMKKILLAAVLLGAASASQAGVRFGFGFGLPLPIPVPTVTIRAPVVCQPPVYVAPAPVYCAPPVVYSGPVCTPPVVYAPAPSVYLGFGNRWCGPAYRGGWHGGLGYGGPPGGALPGGWVTEKLPGCSQFYHKRKLTIRVFPLFS